MHLDSLLNLHDLAGLTSDKASPLGFVNYESLDITVAF